MNLKKDCTKPSHMVLKSQQDILAYRLLKSASLSNEHEQATFKDLI